MTDLPLIAQLAGYLQRPMPESVRTSARLDLLDWPACVAATKIDSRLKPIRIPAGWSAEAQLFALARALDGALVAYRPPARFPA